MPKKLSQEIEQKAIKIYLSGYSANKTAKKLNIGSTSVQRILKRNNFKCRSQSEAWRLNSPLNEKIFSERNEYSCYWAGFLAADGCIIDNRVNIVLSAKDDNHIKKFKKFVESNNMLTYYNNGYSLTKAVKFSIYCKNIVNDLYNFGVTSNKTFTLKAINPNKYFWRGMVDGDGYIGIEKDNRPHLELVGSKPLLNQFLIYIQNICPYSKVTVRPHKSIYRIALSRKAAYYVLYDLYNDANVYLDRKYQKWKEIHEKYKDKYNPLKDKND